MRTATLVRRGFQLRYAGVCARCDEIMSEGEWGEPGGSGTYVHLGTCPRHPAKCAECNIQHAGECL